MNKNELMAMFSLIDETFTSEQITGMLVSTLMHIYRDDKEKVIEYLANMKQYSSEMDTLH